jgi:hypothetical protein
MKNADKYSASPPETLSARIPWPARVLNRGAGNNPALLCDYQLI